MPRQGAPRLPAHRGAEIRAEWSPRRPAPKRVAVAPPPRPTAAHSRQTSGTAGQAAAAGQGPRPLPARCQHGGYNPGYGAFGAPAARSPDAYFPPILVRPGQAPPQMLARARRRRAPSPKASTPGLTKRSVILFAAGASDPAKVGAGFDQIPRRRS